MRDLCESVRIKSHSPLSNFMYLLEYGSSLFILGLRFLCHAGSVIKKGIRSWERSSRTMLKSTYLSLMSSPYKFSGITPFPFNHRMPSSFHLCSVSLYPWRISLSVLYTRIQRCLCVFKNVISSYGITLVFQNLIQPCVTVSTSHYRNKSTCSGFFVLYLIFTWMNIA